jgi:hypothetical protein
MTEPRQQQQDPGIFQKPQDVIDVVYFLASVIATCFTPVLRSGMGTRGCRLGLQAMFFILFFAGFTDCPILVWYIPVFLALVVFRMATADRTAHSQYPGRPWPLFFLSEKRARTLEPFLVFGAAIFISPYSAGLADFLLFGAVALFIVFAVELEVVRSIRRRQRDAEIDMQNQMRWMQGEDW